ncbi:MULTISPECIES: mechanosensitive ion channel domain-containing protein [Roseivirga]|jgi:small-conductance mechanosensitive channel|uniref:Mechanosensitive ion channel protein MscS n=1 Tax=Roseivirga spongicola TaxID=333140 RepID=A0A150XBJ1_9BACT|nr:MULTISPECIES: mechanosensitive ion channel domain-containing protein [Roseivirga]PWL28322.1 MAG: mechanosensitive ion channel protein MscS [Roseivirga sp. XM-24bin3]KYG76078.1 mechanosensitive ion channel protein MscS [Roseivirga spongicola]MBO6494293.1 mechanosensitive ion channel [Roseivirga sp.]MBO6659267.1 mechanosensitive ion channel [Roseivirga sp.]MBO6760403.1 mechanosensitive ion channel [Roseivirga sp.]
MEVNLPFDFLHYTRYEALNLITYVAAILALAHILLRILRAILKKAINKSSDEIRVDPTKYKFLSNALGFIIYTVATILIFISIPQFRTVGVTLFASAGIIAAIIGFASQAAFSNIVSGIFIVIFKPFRVGDIVRISNLYSGTVEDITLRHTVIKDFENKRLIIPNSVISAETIHNFNIVDEMVCNHIFYGISYDSNIDLAMKIIQEEAMAHPNFIDKRTDEEKDKGNPAVIVRLLDFGESSINLRAQVWAEDPGKGFELKCDINKSIKERFDREGIEIPFPHRTIVYKEAKKKES